jgi:hypothetical protein
VIPLGRIIAFGMAMLLPLGMASTAKADVGVNIGPARQLVEPGEDRVEVYVHNPTDQKLNVKALPYIHTGTDWVVSKQAGLVIAPRAIELAAGEQKTVEVFIPSPSVPCSLVGVGFTINIVKEQNGVTAQGVGLAQLAVNGRGGTEQDCLEILPGVNLAANSTPAASPPYWVLAIPLVLAIGLYLKVRRMPTGRRNNTYGF